MKRSVTLIMFVVLLIPSVLSTGCVEAEAVPAFLARSNPIKASSSTPAITAFSTPTVTQSAISPSSTPQPGATPEVIPAVPVINVEDAFNLIQKNKDNPDFIILDVRTTDEFKNGHLANAGNIDYYSSDFKSIADKLDRHKEYLIYCRSGIRGTAATRIMIGLGFTRVYNLTGGIVQWINAGYPTLK